VFLFEDFGISEIVWGTFFKVIIIIKKRIKKTK
jgi:hypothetical protein